MTFAKKPSQEVKAVLKHLGLRWNPFRNEWQGYADEKLVKESLAKSGGKVEVVNE